MTALAAKAPPRWLAPAIYAAVLALLIAALRVVKVPLLPSEVARAVEGWALLASSGKLLVSEMAATHSPASFVLVMAVRAVTGIAAAQAAGLVSAVIGAGLIALWLRAMVRAGHSPLVAALLTGLLAANPLFAAALFAGPDVLLVLLGLWVFAGTIFPLRRFGDVDAFMQCSAALCLLVFAGPLGLVAAALAGVTSVLSLPRDVPLRHLPAAYLVLLFPLLLAGGGLVFVNWSLAHDALGFLPDALRYGPSLLDAGWHAVPRILLAVCLASPLVLAALFDRRMRGRPMIQLVLLVPGFAALASALTLVVSPLVAGVAGLAASAAIAARWNQGKARGGLRLVALVMLLLLGVGGGGAAMLIAAPDAATPRMERAAADAALGRHLAALDSVMIDGSHFPEVVAARGFTRGLVAYADTGFQVALLEKRVQAAHVAVPAPDASRPYDRVSRTFPEIYERGLPGFRLTYDGGGWRVWSRADNSDERPNP